MPDEVRTHVAQGGGEQGPGPLGIPRRRLFVKLQQDALFILRQVLAGPSRTGLVLQGLDSAGGEAGAPFADGGGPLLELGRDRFGGQARGRREDNPGPEHHALLGSRGAAPNG